MSRCCRKSLAVALLALPGGVRFSHAFRSASVGKRPYMCHERSASQDDNTAIVAPAATGDDDDAPATDPWVLRSVTFACLDGSPSSPDPQLLSDYLMEMGACSTAITDHDRDTSRESPIFREPGDDLAEEEWSTAETASQNTKAALIRGDVAVGTNVWNRCDVTAHVPATVDIVQLAEGIRTAFELPSVPRYAVDEIPDVDWVVKVQSAWKPIVAHGFVLRFPWHTEEDVAVAIDNALVDADGEENIPYEAYATITLQGGIAFGTGEHPTTRLCLKFLKEILTSDEEEGTPKISKLLDYGSGSGVLGLAACSLSPQLTAVGVDIDADAVAIANANAEINRLPMTSYLPAQTVIDSGDAESASVMMRGAAANAVETLPSDLDGGECFDACAANILAGPLMGLASTLADMVRPGGQIGLSGILEAQARKVVESYSEFFEDVQVAGSEGGWVLITGRKAI